jgi:hypothetical protein
MKTFKNIVIVKHPLEPLWNTVRDRLPELVPLVDDLESITVIERSAPVPGRVRLVNQWRTRQSVPALLQSRLGATAIGWIDRNEWDDSTRCCSWQIEPNILGEFISCRGATSYEPAVAGRGTRITLEGVFDLAPAALRGVAGPFERPVTAFVESIVTTLVPKNFRKIFEAASRLQPTTTL